MYNLSHLFYKYWYIYVLPTIHMLTMWDKNGFSSVGGERSTSKPSFNNTHQDDCHNQSTTGRNLICYEPYISMHM